MYMNELVILLFSQQLVSANEKDILLNIFNYEPQEIFSSLRSLDTQFNLFILQPLLSSRTLASITVPKCVKPSTRSDVCTCLVPSLQFLERGRLRPPLFQRKFCIISKTGCHVIHQLHMNDYCVEEYVDFIGKQKLSDVYSLPISIIVLNQLLTSCRLYLL